MTIINQVKTPSGSASAPSIKVGIGASGFYRAGAFLASTIKGVRQKLTGALGIEINFKTLTALGGTNQTLTVAQLQGGVINGTPTGAAAYTTPTATELDAMVSGVQTGDSFVVYLVNTSGGANAITVTGGTGVTVKGTAAVAQNRMATLVFLRTGAAAWDVWVPAG